MLPKANDLHNESDVEQKFLYGYLTSSRPLGLGFGTADVRTKQDIRSISIGKGTEAKLYYPDYVITLSGLPLLIVEAKGPGEDLDKASREARLYATELNSRYKTGLNPCKYCLVSSGLETRLYPVDSDQPLAVFTLDHATDSDIGYSTIIDKIGRATLQKSCDAILQTIETHARQRPVELVGGYTVRDEEIRPNTFGVSFSLEYRHLFNPTTLGEREYIARNAYVPSMRRGKHLQDVDRIIRAATLPSEVDSTTIENTADPKEITGIFNSRQLEKQVVLLIGSVGAGKTTFIDHLQTVVLSNEIKAKTVWVRLNFNNAPLDRDLIYRWVQEQVKEQLALAVPDVDLDALENLLKLYSPQVNKVKKGPLSMLDPESAAYKERMVDELTKLQSDLLGTVRNMERYICSERGRLLIIVFDNCDKRTKDEQLLAFQVSQWIQSTFRSLVIMPIRDVTYDLHRGEAPLDTALKDLIFRIEAPNFHRVLMTRIKLAASELKRRNPHQKSVQFEFGDKDNPYASINQFQVEFPLDDLGLFLASIVRSLFDHEEMIKTMISGLAAGDMRRAFEIFLDFCKSGYVDEAEILKIRQLGGNYSLPLHVVTRVLLRGNRRFYDGNVSTIKNLFQCSAEEKVADHFVRYRILRLLADMHNVRGPNGVRGYHRAETLVTQLALWGHSPERAMDDLRYLLRNKCILAEHLNDEKLENYDLIKLTSAGFVHLQLLDNFGYLSACAEDCWLTDEALARDIAGRISSTRFHVSRECTLLNSSDVIRYLAKQPNPQIVPTEDVFNFSQPPPIPDLGTIQQKLQKNLDHLYAQRRQGRP
jgi:energy-coupling factor transporter ATP-binding protein EcfA2